MAKPFAKATGDRVKITNKQALEIKKLYKDIDRNINKRIAINFNKDWSRLSSPFYQDQYLKELKQEVQKRMTELDSQLNGIIQNNMYKVSQSVLKDNDKLLERMGFKSIGISNLHIASDVVNQVASGALYTGKWTLSSSIWGDNEKKLNEINNIVARGIAEQLPTYDIAKALERYVNPSRAKPWDWGKVYPGSRKVIDYNAQRLARTMVSHAYAESFVRATKDNPFIESYRWISSGSDRMCPICADRDGNIYSKEDLPLDHPNGMCTFEVVLSKSYEEIGSSIADWINDEGDESLNKAIDKFAESMYMNGKTNINIKDLRSSLVTSRIEKLAANRDAIKNR